DYNIMNNPDYVHYNLNNNSVITGASNGEEDRICWACHGYSGGDSQADFDEQPTDGHSSNYNLTSAHNCTYCHHNDNVNTNFNAPQNRAHTWYDDEINTPGVSGCEDCHAETEMYNTSHVDDDHVTRIGLAVHYGTGHTYLENVRHTDTYCKYCHMNTSTTFSDAFSNPWNMQRSEHSSSEDTPGCTVAECHNAYALHGTEMTEPYYTDASCTSGNCHNSSEFQKHNGAVNCTECHMNNTQTNIHPIKYLQLDGITFSTSLVTAAPCVTCHQDNVADAIMAEWDHTPQKVEHQHHSEDPANGSKWGDFWNYMPDVFAFPTSWVRNEMNDSTNTNSTIA
ncbi:MAG: hypothetical protein KAJ07_13225, partial [Planctomycetes bacterium]|nr:hypothetical protein [Planctomycetota bacterium]